MNIVEHLKKMHELVTQLWRFVKKWETRFFERGGYISVTDTDWSEIVDESTEMAKSFNNDPRVENLAAKLILAYLDYLEEEVKREINEAKEGKE